MELRIGSETPFNLEYTLSSGQVFRWDNRGEWWYGVVRGGVLKVKQELDSLYCISSSEAIDSTTIRHYFRLDDDLTAVMSSISRSVILISSKQQSASRVISLRLVKILHVLPLNSLVS
jgi:N-glycosylase/DNA lyase